MAEPKIAEKVPAVMDLEPGTYYWCACGESSNQPFCDGSHAGTEFTPLEVKVEEKRKAALCQCKHSANGAFCDGTHSKI